MKKVSLYFLAFLLFQPLATFAVPHTSSISMDEIRPGDLLFFWINEKVRHVGIYLEDGIFFHASTSEGVKLSNLNDDYWRYRLISVRRVKHHISLNALKRDFARYDSARYGYGSEGPNRFDCSGLVWRVFREHGVVLPRSTKVQIHTGVKVMSGREYLLKNRR